MAKQFPIFTFKVGAISENPLLETPIRIFSFSTDYSSTDDDNDDEAASGVNDTLGSNAGGIGGIGNQSYTLGLSDTSSNNSIPVSGLVAVLAAFWLRRSRQG